MGTCKRYHLDMSHILSLLYYGGLQQSGCHSFCTYVHVYTHADVKAISDGKYRIVVDKSPPRI